MTNNENRRTSLLWPAAFLGAVAGLWCWLAQGDRLQVFLACAGLVLAVVLGSVWAFRARAAGRLQAALDAFAEREIAQAHPNGSSRGQLSSAR
jgi:hypothetical protein